MELMALHTREPGQQSSYLGVYHYSGPRGNVFSQRQTEAEAVHFAEDT